MNKSDNKKTPRLGGAQKMRDVYNQSRKSKKPSSDLLEIIKKSPQDIEKNKVKKIARPITDLDLGI